MATQHTPLSTAASKTGHIHVVCGSMFSGKSEELIRLIERARYAQLNIKCYKPKIDDRYHKDEIVSHKRNSIESKAIAEPFEILREYEKNPCQIIAIDEAQFLDKTIVSVCTELANDGCTVIVAGLDMDFKGTPFGSMPTLMAIAETVQKFHAICKNCHGEAYISHRTIDSDKQVVLGAENEYIALCRKCHNIAMEARKKRIQNDHE